MEIPELINEAVESVGCEVILLRQLPGRNLRIFVDREPNGVRVDDLTTLTRAIHEGFERDGLDPGNFTIEVLSPGLDRHLVRDKDFVRFAGQQVHVKLKEKRSLDGRKNYKGRLVGLEEGKVVVINPDGKGEPWRFTRREINEVRIVPDLPKLSEEPSAGGRKRKPRKARRKRPKDH